MCPSDWDVLHANIDPSERAFECCHVGPGCNCFLFPRKDFETTRSVPALNFAVSKATKNTSLSGLVPLFSLDLLSSKCCPHTGHTLGRPCKNYGWFCILLLTAPPCFETTYKINKLKTFSTHRGPHCVCDGIRSTR